MEDEGHQPAADELRPEEHTRRARWRSLLNFTTRNHVTTLAVALAFSIVSGVVIPAVSIFMGKIFNQFTEFGGGKISGHDLLHRVAVNCIALTAIGTSSCLLNGGFFMFWLVFGELQAKSVRDKLFDGLMQKDMEWYDLRKNGTRELQMATSQPLGLVVQYAVTAVASLGVAFYNSWKLTLVTLATFPIAVVVLSSTSARTQPAIDAQENSLSEAAKSSTSALSAIELVKCFNGQEGEIRRYVEKIVMAAKAYYRQAHANAFQIGVFRLVIRGMFVEGFWYGSSLVDRHKVTSGQVLTTFWAALMATQAIEQMLPQLIVLEKGRAAGAALQAVRLRVERGRRITEMVGRQIPTRCQGDIDIRGLTFSYPARPDLPAIDNASFLFAAGEITFVIGGSGSGKSTLGNLIMRYYSNWSGSISIDDNAIQTLDLGWLRRNVTLVQQQSLLFNETLFRNIAFGRQDHDRVSKDEIRDACQVALLQHTINDLPDGLDTVVAPGGFSMSGGQRQRVAIARAKLRDTPILILDESTSALDYISRSLVMDAIREWRKGKTTIIITHDVSQIYEDEFVYVMDKGKVLQEGYKIALEKNTAGLFYSFLQSARGDPIKRDDTSRNHHHHHVYPAKHRKTGRSKSDGAVRSARLDPSDSVDSLDIQYPHNAKYIPTIFGGSATDLRNRRPSQNQLSPLTPLSSALSSRLRTPLGMELVEFSGRKTRQRHVDILRRTPRTAHPLAVTRPLSSASTTRPSRMGRRKGEQRQPQIASLKKILATIWPNLDTIGRTRLVLGFFSAFVHAAATPTFSFLFAKLLATFFRPTPGRNRESMRWSLAMLAVSLGDAIASYLMHYLLEICAQAWIDRLRTEAYRRVLDRPRIWFDKERNSVSRLSECLDGNAEEMRNLVGRFAGFAFVAASMTTMAIIWSFVICWKLTIVGVAAAPLMYAVTRGFEHVSGRWEGQSHDASEAAGAIFMETFTNVKLVRALTLETYFRNKYAEATRQTLSVGFRRSAYSGLFYGLSESGILFVTALIFYYGAVLVSSQQFTTANILAVFTMLTFSIANANSIVSFIPQINSSRDTGTRLLRLAYLPSTSREKSGSIRLDTPLPICMHNLSFAYPSRPGQLVLDQVNLEIRPNSSLAVVGASGSGKSTLASLILGLYPVSSSSSPLVTGNRRHHDSFVHEFPLVYAGHALPTLSLSSLRSQIAIVPQVPVLFPTTIAANIAYGCQSDDMGTSTTSIRSSSATTTATTARKAAIVRAAKRAGIHGFITSLPRSYDTVIGDGGQGLSGGQAQRIAIARALILRPKLLILDEATSSLDAENARLVRDTVQGLVIVDRPSLSSPTTTSSMGLAGKYGQESDDDDDDDDDDEGMSVLIITHAKEMMQVAEFIVVLDRGRVVESGTWDYLISSHSSTPTPTAQPPPPPRPPPTSTTTTLSTSTTTAASKMNRNGTVPGASSSSSSSPPGIVGKRTGALLKMISGGEWRWPVNSHDGPHYNNDGGDGVGGGGGGDGEDSEGVGEGSRMNFGDVRWK